MIKLIYKISKKINDWSEAILEKRRVIECAEKGHCEVCKHNGFIYCCTCDAEIRKTVNILGEKQ